jgi:hypothetical protein
VRRLEVLELTDPDTDALTYKTVRYGYDTAEDAFADIPKLAIELVRRHGKRLLRAGRSRQNALELGCCNIVAPSG